MSDLGPVGSGEEYPVVSSAPAGTPTTVNVGPSVGGPVPARETIGFSDKVKWPAVCLVACGVVLCVLDQLGVIDVEDELWITLLGAAAGTGTLGFLAPASPTNLETNR